jgi:hypothetical protein
MNSPRFEPETFRLESGINTFETSGSVIKERLVLQSEQLKYQEFKEA